MNTHECPTKVRRVEHPERALIVSREMGGRFAPLTLEVTFRDGTFRFGESERNPMQFASEVARDLTAFFGCAPKEVLADLLGLQSMTD